MRGRGKNNFWKIHYDKMKHLVDEMEWSIIHPENNVNDRFATFIIIFSSLINGRFVTAIKKKKDCKNSVGW